MGENLTISELFDKFGVSLPEESSRRNRNYIPLSELKNCLETPVELTEETNKTKTSATIREIFLRAFFSRDSFWLSLEKNIQKIPQNTAERMNGKIPSNMLYYHKNIPNTECPNRNVKNILIWLGVLDEQSAAVVSEDGILNSAGLKNWCHNGYIDPATKKRIYEKDLLEQFYISGDFWNRLSEYQKSMPYETIAAIGGRVSGWKNTVLSEIPQDKGTKQNIAISDVFHFLGIEIPRDEIRRTRNYKYIPIGELPDYLKIPFSIKNAGEGKEEITTTGGDIFLATFLSGNNFWQHLKSQLKDIPPEVIEQMNGKIPSTHNYYRNNISKNILPVLSPKEVLIWLGVIDETSAKLVNDNGYLTLSGLKNWCHNGYKCPHTGTHLYGKDLLQFAYQSGNFWKTLSDYSTSLDFATTKAIGGRIPWYPGSISLRVSGNHLGYSSKKELFKELGVDITTGAAMPSIFEIKNDEITARESFSIIPLRSPSFESINQSTRIRIIRILSKIVDIGREQGITRDHFKIQIKGTDVILSPKVSAVARILNGAEQYITDTIIGESESDPDYNIEYRRKATY